MKVMEVTPNNLNKFKDIDFSVIPSSPIVKKNPVLFFISLMKIFFSILISFLYLIFKIHYF